MTREPTTRDVLAAHSTPLPLDPKSVSRRMFLAATGAATTVAMLPTWLAEEVGAAPLGASDGIVILITMTGGNDGLNTVIPIDDSTYRARRGGLAISAASALPIGNGRALHPALGTIKQRWDRGEVAVLDGVGHPSPDLSHFTSMARVMHGGVSGPTSSGWLGRYLDQLPSYHTFSGVALGSSLPLTMRGNARSALALPARSDGLFRAETADWSQRQYNALGSMASGSTGLGALGDALARNNATALQVAARLGDAYSHNLPEDSLSRQLTICAHLINANLGIRVFQVMYGDFDTHAGQAADHNQRMVEFDQAVAAFYANLDPAYAGRSLLLTNSEFGRRIEANNSNGTDHGSANTWMAIGAGVRGGFYGSMPPLNSPDRHGNLSTTVDFRQVYETVIDRWLAADGSSVVGQSFGDLGFLAGPIAGQNPGSSTISIADQRMQISRLYLAYYLRLPDSEGLAYWMRQLSSGRSLTSISDAFAQSAEFKDRYGNLSNVDFVRLVYRNVLQREADAAGLDYWTQRLAGRDSRGRVMVGFSESPEFVAGTRDRLYEHDANGPIGRLYWAYFLRPVDFDGLQHWLATGLPPKRISEAFANTPEFRDRYGQLNNDGFVRLVYQNVMSRTPDDEGLQYWKSRLNSGFPRGEMMVGFSESPEFKLRRA